MMGEIELGAMGKADIGELLKSVLTDLWGNVVYYVTFQFVDPFWWWLVAVIVYVSALTLALALWRFYFGELPSWLQKLLGSSVVVAILGLVIYAKGERDARAHDKAKRLKGHKPDPETDDEDPKPRPPPRKDDGGFGGGFFDIFGTR